MTQEKSSFSFQRRSNVFSPVDIFLTSINHADVAYTKNTYKKNKKKQNQFFRLPRLNGSNRFSRISLASVPSSIKSNFVKTPIVRIPAGSHSLAIFNASDVAKSIFAAVTAKIKQLSFVIYVKSMSRICASISTGWSPTGTFVKPGKSINVKFNTKKRKKTYRV